MKIRNAALTFDARSEILVPFLKWAGGKRWLVANHSSLLQVPFRRYIEPFLGSAAIFFHLRPAAALLADTNRDLIECYEAIRDDWQKVGRILEKHQRRHSREYYYQQRERRPRLQTERAARFIYLNRTCWNGLYRVNLQGEFNVPIGTKNSVLLDSDNFEQTSALLRRASLRCQDFETTVDAAREGDLIFADPPYTVKHNCNGFIKYNESIFSWDDQIRLHQALTRAKSRGARIVLLNADHQSIRDLYRNFGEFKRLSRASVLAANSSFRGQATELAICSNG